jgi:hypothetical protein
MNQNPATPYGQKNSSTLAASKNFTFSRVDEFIEGTGCKKI